ncbi:hypothetical protein MEQU1_001478 [Malassezia equina]|uniref:RING-type domain-containing protein n=1 Tax=Malassezia equina TaxID=1381935 RepID=A0AAF0EHH5_9BASI|nr:hypothetical protein MEQU1_001478 [Malassezia equina]
MTRHSKQNTALGHFTYAEYQMLKDRWGSRRLRLSKENMRAFYACYLCLQTAQRPVTCHEGHLYCKECVLSDLVQQKTKLADYAQQREEAMRKKAHEAQAAEQQAHAERVAQFAQGDAILSQKRKREEDASYERKRVAAGETRETPAFWLPSQAPEHDRHMDDSLALADDRASTTMCTASSEKPHKLLSKHLVDVHFHERKVDGDKQLYCPCCKKEYSALSKTHVLRACGHVLCTPCTDTLVRAPLKKGDPTTCPECSVSIKKSRDVISLVREGTGYASGGQAEAHSKGLAFQG